MAVTSQPGEVGPCATSIAERLVPILAAPAGSMPRSIIENRQSPFPWPCALPHPHIHIDETPAVLWVCDRMES